MEEWFGFIVREESKLGQSYWSTVEIKAATVITLM